MSGDLIRCYRCKGLKKYQGIGGIMKDCDACNATGKIYLLGKDKFVASVIPAIEPEMETKKKRKSPTKSKPLEPISEELFDNVHSLEEVSPGITEVKKNETPLIRNETPKPVYTDFEIALLDEMRMDPIEWRKKYSYVKELFVVKGDKIDEVVSKVNRMLAREVIARRQVAAPRKVSLSAMQDSSVIDDASVIAFAAKHAVKE